MMTGMVWLLTWAGVAGTNLGPAGGAPGPERRHAAAPPALLPATAPGGRTPERVLAQAFEAGFVADGFAVRFDPQALARDVPAGQALLIRDFPLEPQKRVDLDVERFGVTGPQFRVVAGRPDGRDEPMTFDPASVVLLRGSVAGQPGSRVFLGLSETVVNGIIEMGQGETYVVVSHRSGAGHRVAGVANVFRARAGGPNPVPFCLTLEPDKAGSGPDQPPEPRRGLRQIQLAVETDRQFFDIFGEAAAATAYAMQLYGYVSDIFMREINVRVDLVYLRLWPTGNVPFTVGLTGFRNYWNANMQSVPRDVAQMFSGRADLPGGVAYLAALCNNNSYSFCGNLVGYFGDPRTASVFHYDPMVAAHELGHNFGSAHTHDYGLDRCDQVTTPPRRGTIMSYCNQTVSGAMAVIDMGFHTGTRTPMRQYIPGRACVVFDCNQNGISDAIDISSGTSPDVNGNGIPDECEDCNRNGILDDQDISSGASPDLNNNGIPDECEPDCNRNNVPDDLDIALGTSQDLHGDGVPDECDADRNNNGISDYNELMADMTLDRDRDRTLDATQDCDQDGISDLEALDGAWNAWCASLQPEHTIRSYHALTGVLMRVGEAGRVPEAQDLVITPDARVLVSSASAHSVVEFDRRGQFVRTLVPAGAGGLNAPAGMLVVPELGRLLVASRGSHAVLEYDLASGAFVRALVPPGSGGLTQPFGLTRGPSGHLFVSAGTNAVYEYHWPTGAFVRVFVSPGSGGLSSPRGLIFNPVTGNLLVASFDTDQVLEYHGSTGAFVRSWLVTGLPVDGPWCLRTGPDRMIYISRHNPFTDTHVTRARIFIFEPRNGYFVRAYVQGLDAGLERPTGFDFVPGTGRDCNRNLIPDECDIASGTSLDVNGNGIPDECEPGVCYANCDGSTTPPVLNVADFTCFLARFAAGHPYANCDGSTTPPVLNVADFTCFLARFAGGCP